MSPTFAKNTIRGTVECEAYIKTTKLINVNI